MPSGISMFYLVIGDIKITVLNRGFDVWFFVRFSFVLSGRMPTIHRSISLETLNIATNPLN